MGCVTLEHLISNLPFWILNQQPALGALHKHDQEHKRDRHDQNQQHGRRRDDTLPALLKKLRNRRWHRRDNARKDDQRNTVTDDRFRKIEFNVNALDCNDAVEMRKNQPGSSTMPGLDSSPTAIP